MATRAEMEARIRQLATERGLDPNFVARVIQGESGWNPAARARTRKEDSGGLFQLNTKNGLGVEALKRGINPHDPRQWEQQAVFALDQVKKGGWRPWTVARKLMNDPSLQTPPARPGSMSVAQNTPMEQATLPTGGMLSSIYSPFEKLAAEQKEQQQQAQIQQLQQQASLPPAPVPQPAPEPAAPPADFAALLMPRIRRGLLSEPGSSLGLLGVP